ncbi:hypothetical protein [Hymenobacter artigasi]|uniref:hypothetical protein n=1 Tax=Hymenobacter artigasi TaxID=2719616 RepID=UPI001B2FFF32|nr:hypothetical protein [Hymenobacter artigasi]
MFDKKVIVLTAGLVSGAFGASGQTAPPAVPPKVSIYLTPTGKQLPNSVGADHWAQIAMRDSVSGIMREYYSSGKLWRVIPFANVRLGIRHGVVLSYDEAGKLYRREDFLSGQRQGELQLFDATGALSRTIVYAHDKKVSQQCFTAAGLPRECQPDKQLPQYPRGTAGLIAAIEQAAVLPTEEVLRHGFGTVVIKLLVDAEATIIGTTVVRAPTARMGQAVLEAVKAIKPFVAAGMVDQEPVSVLYYLPIKLGHPINGWAMSNAYDDALKVTFLAAE